MQVGGKDHYLVDQGAAERKKIRVFGGIGKKIELFSSGRPRKWEGEGGKEKERKERWDKGKSGKERKRGKSAAWKEPPKVERSVEKGRRERTGELRRRAENVCLDAEMFCSLGKQKKMQIIPFFLLGKAAAAQSCIKEREKKAGKFFFPLPLFEED